MVKLRGESDQVQHVIARPLDDRSGGKRRTGFEIRLKDRTRTSGSAVLVATTGLDVPTELKIPFSWGESVKLSSQRQRQTSP